MEFLYDNNYQDEFLNFPRVIIEFQFLPSKILSFQQLSAKKR